jgi:hypothetical protein
MIGATGRAPPYKRRSPALPTPGDLVNTTTKRHCSEIDADVKRGPGR